MPLVPAVHSQRDEVVAILDVADDDAALLPELPPDGRETERTPAAPVRGGPQKSAATGSVERDERANPYARTRAAGGSVVEATRDSRPIPPLGTGDVPTLRGVRMASVVMGP